MANSPLTLDHQNLSLQKQAIENARAAFSRLPSKDTFFQQCIDEADSILEVVRSVAQSYRAHKDEKPTQLLQAFQLYKLWLHDVSDVVDIAVQTQVGIRCPLWAPINFVLKISKDPSQAAEPILKFIQTISENLPRFDIYEKLPSDHVLQVVLLNIFTDVVEFSVLALRYFGRGKIVRFGRQLVCPFEKEFRGILDRIKRRSKIADNTVMATEMLKAAEFRKSRLHIHLRHVRVLTDLKMLFRIILQKAAIIPAYLLAATGWFYVMIGKPEKALEAYRAALAKVVSQEIPVKFVILTEIGWVLQLQGKFEEAETIYRQALEGRERLLGKQHEDTLRSAFYLAFVVADRDNYKEAEVMDRQTLTTGEMVLGKEHKDTLLYACELGYVLIQQHKYEEAEVLVRRTLKSCEMALGEDHIYTLRSRYWLAYVLRHQEKYEEAEAISRRTLKAKERVLGKEHKNTLQAAYELAHVLADQKKYKEAEAIHRRTLEARKEVLGSAHLETLWSSYRLANVRRQQGKYEEAETIYSTDECLRHERQWVDRGYTPMLPFA